MSKQDGVMSYEIVSTPQDNTRTDNCLIIHKTGSTRKVTLPKALTLHTHAVKLRAWTQPNSRPLRAHSVNYGRRNFDSKLGSLF